MILIFILGHHINQTLAIIDVENNGVEVMVKASLPILHIIDVKARCICHCNQSFSPLLDLLFLEIGILVFIKSLFVSSSLFSHVGGVDAVEHRKQRLRRLLLLRVLHRFHKLAQTPARVRIIWGEDNHYELGPLNCVVELRRNGLSPLQLVVVSESVDPFLVQSGVEVIHETLAGVFASEAQENVVQPFWCFSVAAV